MSSVRYGNYRESGIDWLGEVPSHWPPTRLRYVAKINPSKTELSSADRSQEVTFLPMDAIGEDGSIRLTETRAISEVETGYTYFRDGDVVIAKITPCFENGKGAVMRRLQGGVGFGTTELIVARPKGKNSPAFLHWLFCSPVFRLRGEASMYGAGGQKRVPDDFLRDFLIGLPPPSEQATIAAFLDRETAKIDALVEEQRRLIALLAEKRRAVISHAVTKGLDPTVPMKDSGVEWLREVPAHWGATSLKRSWTVTDCKHLTAGFIPDGIPLASIREVQARFVELADAKRTSEEFFAQLIEGGRKPQPGDLIFSRNATVGEVAEVANWHPDFAMGQDVCMLRMRSPNSSSAYLYHLLKSDVVREQLDLAMVGSTFKRVNVEEIRNLMIPVPPAPEQMAIAHFMEKQAQAFDALIAEAQAATTLLQERRAALISAAVTGKIDVRGLVPAVEEAA